MEELGGRGNRKTRNGRSFEKAFLKDGEALIRILIREYELLGDASGGRRWGTPPEV